MAAELSVEKPVREGLSYNGSGAHGEHSSNSEVHTRIRHREVKVAAGYDLSQQLTNPALSMGRSCRVWMLSLTLPWHATQVGLSGILCPAVILWRGRQLRSHTARREEFCEKLSAALLRRWGRWSKCCMVRCLILTLTKTVTERDSFDKWYLVHHVRSPLAVSRRRDEEIVVGRAGVG